MKKHIQLLVMLMLITTTLLAACGGKSNNTGVVPNTLQTIEGAAEDIIDLAPNTTHNGEMLITRQCCNYPSTMYFPEP